MGKQKSVRILLTGNTSFKVANFRMNLIRCLISMGYEVHVAAPYDEYTEDLVSVGCIYHRISMSRSGVNIFQEMHLQWQCFRIVHSTSPDFIFSYTIKNNIYFGISSRILGVGFIPNVTGLGPAFSGRASFRKMISALCKFAFRDSLVIFFQNSADMELLRKAGICNHVNSDILPGSGVDLIHFKPKNICKNENMVLLMISRVIPEKGVRVFASAAKILREELPEIKFEILGKIDEGARDSISEEEIRSWERYGNIEYIGEVKDVRERIAGCDCVVLPSFYREGTPRSLLEALASGRPVITTNIPGCKDTVRDGENGFLIEPKSVDSLVCAIKKFYFCSESERRKMSENSRKLAEKKFDEKIVIRKYLQYLE